MEYHFYYTYLLLSSFFLLAIYHQVIEKKLDVPYDISITINEFSILLTRNPVIETPIIGGLKIWKKQKPLLIT